MKHKILMKEKGMKNIDEGEVNEVYQSENIIYEVNKNGNNMMVYR